MAKVLLKALDILALFDHSRPEWAEHEVAARARPADLDRAPPADIASQQGVRRPHEIGPLPARAGRDGAGPAGKR